MVTQEILYGHLGPYEESAVVKPAKCRGVSTAIRFQKPKGSIWEAVQIDCMQTLLVFTAGMGRIQQFYTCRRDSRYWIPELHTIRPRDFYAEVSDHCKQKRV